MDAGSPPSDRIVLETAGAAYPAVIAIVALRKRLATGPIAGRVIDAPPV